jgi:zinc transport system ATP-binding protein
VPAVAVDGRPLELGHVSLAFAGDRVLADISLHVGPTDFVALLGANGSGKTTLLRISLGLLRPSAGRVKLFGRDPTDPRARERVGYVPQRAAITPRLPATVEEVVAAGRAGRQLLGGFTRADLAAAHEALERVGLSAQARLRIGELSGGQQQRALIARALANAPSLLVLDEPTAGVDRESQHQFAAVLRELHRQGTSIVLVAHDLGAVGRDVTRVLLLHQGHIDEISLAQARAQVGLFVEDHPA